jgi:hypothetical protein
MRIRRHLVETIVKAARVTGIDPALLMAIADKESSFSTHVQAKTSSATGLFQFIERTWLQVVRDFGAKHGLAKEAAATQWIDDELTVPDPAERARILELRRNPYLSALLAAEMLSRDRARIARSIGRDLTRGETYLSHFLGPDDAERFMEKVVGQPNSAAATLLPEAGQGQQADLLRPRRAQGQKPVSRRGARQVRGDDGHPSRALSGRPRGGGSAARLRGRALSGMRRFAVRAPSPGGRGLPAPPHSSSSMSQ